jgi:hypothetical protein
VEVNAETKGLRHNNQLSSPPAQGRWDRQPAFFTTGARPVGSSTSFLHHRRKAGGIVNILSSPPAQGRWDRQHHAPNRRCARAKAPLRFSLVIAAGFR